MKKVLTGVLALLAISSMAMAEEAKSLEDRVAELEKEMAGVKTASGFEFHGYARSGLLVNQGQKSTGAYNDIEGGVGRLGNEGNTYLETELVKGFTGDNGAWAKYHVMFASSSTSKNDWVDGVAVRQGYVEMGNLSELKGSLSTATFWAGKRFYGRDDIHITDYYWRDMSGTGAGVQGIKMGDKTLDVALIGRDGDSLGNGEAVLPVTLDARVNMPNDLQVELAIHSAKDNTNAEFGLQAGAVKGLKGFYGSGDGFSKAAVQFGLGLGTNLGKAGNTEADDSDMALRGLTYGVKSMGNANLMTQAVLHFDMPDKGDEVMELSLAGRYMKPVNKNLSMQYEAGLAMTNQDGKDGMDIKLTAAPTLALNDSFWGRPQLRVFGSLLVATGDRKIGGDDTELRAGVQMEAWW